MSVSWKEWLNEDVSVSLPSRRIAKVAAVARGETRSDQHVSMVRKFGETEFSIKSGDFLPKIGIMNETRIRMPVRHRNLGRATLVCLAIGLVGMVLFGWSFLALCFVIGAGIAFDRMTGIDGIEYAVAGVTLTNLAEETRGASGGALGGAALGGLVLGGAGLVAGSVIGKGQKEIVHGSLAFPDGKRALIEVPPATFAQMSFVLGGGAKGQ